MPKQNKVDWNAIYNQVGSVKTGQFLFPKAGKNRIRLLQHPDDEVPYRVVQNNYQGQIRDKYLFMGYSPDDTEPDLKGIVVPLTVFRAIVGYLAEGYEFFDSEAGLGITILRDQQGRRVNYQVMASRNPQEADEEIIKSMGDRNLDYFAKEWDDWQNRKAGTSSPSSKEEEEDDSWS